MRVHPLVPDPLPSECAHLYPEGFTYPIGYFIKGRRVSDPEVLARFPLACRPFCAVSSQSGDPYVDSQGLLALRNFENAVKPDSKLTSLLHQLEHGAPPDAPMQAAYDCEERIRHAAKLAQVGSNLDALRTIEALPAPWRESAEARRAIYPALLALERYDEALECARDRARAPRTDYDLQLCREDEADCLLRLGRVEACVALLDELDQQGDTDTATRWGLRACLALREDDPDVARGLLRRAAAVDQYHAHKLIWQPLLAPLHRFIAYEFLDSEQQPRHATENGEVRDLALRGEVEMVLGNFAEAARLRDAVSFRRCFDAEATEPYTLLCVGLGVWRFAQLACFLRRRDDPFAQVVLALADLAYGTGTVETVLASAKDLNPGPEQLERLRLLATIASDPAKKSVEVPRPERELVAFLEAPRRFEDNEMIVITKEREGAFTLEHYRGEEALAKANREKDAPPDLRDPENAGLTVTTTVLASEREFCAWLEGWLTENDARRAVTFGSKYWDVRMHAAVFRRLVTLTDPAYPRLNALRRQISRDPTGWHSHGLSGFPTSILDRLLNVVEARLRSQGRVA